MVPLHSSKNSSKKRNLAQRHLIRIESFRTCNLFVLPRSIFKHFNREGYFKTYLLVMLLTTLYYFAKSIFLIFDL